MESLVAGAPACLINSSASIEKVCSWKLLAKRSNQGGERGRLMASTGIVEIEAWKRLTPILENPEQLSAFDIGSGVVLRYKCDADPIEGCSQQDLHVIDGQRPAGSVSSRAARGRNSGGDPRFTST